MIGQFISLITDHIFGLPNWEILKLFCGGFGDLLSNVSQELA